jgi:hypothetical protein
MDLNTIIFLYIWLQSRTRYVLLNNTMRLMALSRKRKYSYFDDEQLGTKRRKLWTYPYMTPTWAFYRINLNEI